MGASKKNNNGDPSCPINGQIKRPCFSVRPDPKTGEMPQESYFGDTRIEMPMGKLITLNRRSCLPRKCGSEMGMGINIKPVMNVQIATKNSITRIISK